MEPKQAKGYILEFVVLRLLEESGYMNVKPGMVRGRGAQHQIDAYGVLSIPTAFIYPVRLISEAKFYDNPIGLPTIRNFVGVIKDISENYFVNSSHQRSSDRYTDAGCLFSANPFTEPAQEYAWAHNVFLTSFSQIDLMRQILTTIDRSVQFPDMVNILNDPNKKGKRKRIINAYKKFLKRAPRIEYPTLVIGILDNVYPVILVGNKGWISRIFPPQETDKLDAMKDFRQDFFTENAHDASPQEHIFKLTIQGEPVFFNLPHFAATKILKRIEKSRGIIAELQIPFNFQRGPNSVRRIISLNVKMPI